MGNEEDLNNPQPIMGTFKFTYLLSWFWRNQWKNNLSQIQNILVANFNPHIIHCGLTSLVCQLRITHQRSPDMTLYDFSIHIDDISPECLNFLTSFAKDLLLHHPSTSIGCRTVENARTKEKHRHKHKAPQCTLRVKKFKVSKSHTEQGTQSTSCVLWACISEKP